VLPRQTPGRDRLNLRARRRRVLALDASLVETNGVDLEEEQQKGLALWAADCAERVLSMFEEDRPDDRRPRKAIEAARSWARGDIPVSAARGASSAANTAARGASEGPPRDAARAAGHAAATAHLISHSIHAAAYALKAISASYSTEAAGAEEDWQFNRVPKELRHLVYPEEIPG
jgi:hypothetical protein